MLDPLLRMLATEYIDEDDLSAQLSALYSILCTAAGKLAAPTPMAVLLSLRARVEPPLLFLLDLARSLATGFRLCGLCPLRPRLLRTRSFRTRRPQRLL